MKIPNINLLTNSSKADKRHIFIDIWRVYNVNKKFLFCKLSPVYLKFFNKTFFKFYLILKILEIPINTLSE